MYQFNVVVVAFLASLLAVAPLVAAPWDGMTVKPMGEVSARFSDYRDTRNIDVNVWVYFSRNGVFVYFGRNVGVRLDGLGRKAVETTTENGERYRSEALAYEIDGGFGLDAVSTTLSNGTKVSLRFEVQMTRSDKCKVTRFDYDFQNASRDHRLLGLTTKIVGCLTKKGPPFD